MAISDVIAALEEAVNSTIGKSNFKPINVMIDNLKTAIDSNIAAQIQTVQASIASVETTANSANATAAANAANKMDKSNPRGTGSISVGGNGSPGGHSAEFGNGSNAAGSYSFATGGGQATVNNTIAMGRFSKATNTAAIAIGYSSEASSQYGIAIGQNATVTLNTRMIAIGMNTNVGGDRSIAIGSNINVPDNNNNTCIGIGINSTGMSNMTIVGMYNNTNRTGTFTVGNGSGDDSRANCFRATTSGVYSMGNYNSSGADYAEMCEWKDGNPDAEDRRGRFVVADSKYITFAGPDDRHILGVISGAPSVCGDAASEDWQGRFKRDIFGKIIIEDLDIPAEYDEDGNELSPAYTMPWYVQNPNWNPDEEYIPREDRKEWDAVGLIGKLVMLDDGTAEVNGYVKPAEGGVATKSDEMTRVKVMERLDDTHIRVWLLPFGV